MTTRNLGLTTFALGAALLGMAGSASAGLVPVYVGEMTTPSSTIFVYTVNFSSNGSSGTESLTSGDFFTLEDIGSPAAESITSSSSFTLSQQLTGKTAPFAAPPDSPSILNLSETYGGATLTADTSFTLTLTYAGTVGTTSGFYSSTDTTALGKNSQAGNVTLPSVPVPEPGTYAALALGGALGAVMLRRRAAKA